MWLSPMPVQDQILVSGSNYCDFFGRWVSQYLPEKEGRDLQQLLGNQEHITVESRQYDWLLNKL